MQAALRAAVDTLANTQGEDPAMWGWGRINRIPFEHPLLDVFDLPPVERRGGAGTVSSNGGTFKQVVDVAQWDSSRVMNAPGQSGQPGSRYYGNLLERWKNGEYFPYLFIREAVEASAEHTLRLTSVQ